MKKTVPQDSHNAGALVLVLALGIAMETANADFVFGTPTNLGPNVNSRFEDAGQTISVDGLSLHFSSNRLNGSDNYDLFAANRPSTSQPWGAAVNLGPQVNSSAMETSPSLATDGLSLFFSDGVWHLYQPRSGGFGKCDLWVATRPTKQDDWVTPVNLGPTINTSAHECSPNISADSLSLFFDSDRSGGNGSVDLWVVTRPSATDTWHTPVNLGSNVNSSAVDAFPSISSDGLVLFFMSDRTGYDLWMTRRASVEDPWGPATNLGPGVNSLDVDACPTISPDGSTLFFMSMRPGGIGGMRDLWQVSIEPVVDLNADGIVDAADMSMIVDHWGTDEPLCDIGPMPWGDGIVDVEDLIVLSEHLFEEEGLIACWALDETEGDIAYDSAAENDAVLIGGTLWQPDGGQANGALQLDGADGHVSTPFVLNPADPEISSGFSVFAWIKGGAPGQVIISQEGGSDWLLTDAQGCIMTALESSGGRSGGPLISETTIIDGNWHQVGFTWDGKDRIVYIDDVEVARDTLSGLKGSDGGLHMGAGKNLEPDTFWFGIIDDIRIYSRVVRP